MLAMIIIQTTISNNSAAMANAAHTVQVLPTTDFKLMASLLLQPCISFISRLQLNKSGAGWMSNSNVLVCKPLTLSEDCGPVGNRMLRRTLPRYDGSLTESLRCRDIML